MKAKKYILRKALIYCNIGLCLIGVVLITVVAGFLTNGGIEWLYAIAAGSSVMAIPLLLCLIQFFIEPCFLVTDKYISKISMKKTLCFIRKDEIYEIVAFIPPTSKKLFLPLWFVMGELYCSKIIIVYSNNREEVDYKYSQFGIGTKITNYLSCQKTQTDLLSLREIKKIAEILDVPFRMVNNMPKDSI